MESDNDGNANVVYIVILSMGKVQLMNLMLIS